MSDLLNKINFLPINQWQLKAVNLTPQTTDINSLKQTDIDTYKTKAVCQKFEAFFLNCLLKEMRATIPKSGLMDSGGQANQIYVAMYDAKIAQEMAKKGGIGLGLIIEKNLSGDGEP